MLERTAATIETSRIQRVLPSSPSSFSSKCSLKNRRQLHTKSWQHVAPDVEFLDACSALMRMPLPASVGAGPGADTGAGVAESSENTSEPSMASTFVLDFLYPNRAVPLLRNLRTTLSPLRPFSGDQKPRALTTRLYTSSSSTTHKRDDSAPTKQDPEASQSSLSQDVPDAGVNTLDGFQPRPDAAEDVNRLQSFLGRSNEKQGHKPVGGPDGALSEAAFLETFEKLDQSAQEKKHFLTGSEALRDILAREHETRVYERVWTLYKALDDAEKKQFRADVLFYLSHSPRPVEAWRVCELFALYTIDEWTDELVEVAVRARLMFQDVATAQAIFTTALERRQLGRGLDPFVVYCFQTSNWSLFFDAWSLFEAKMPPIQSRPLDPTGLILPQISGSSASPDGEGSTKAVSTKLVSSGFLPAKSHGSRPFQFQALPTLPDFEVKLQELYKFAQEMDEQRARKSAGRRAGPAPQELPRPTDQQLAQILGREFAQLTDDELARIMLRQPTYKGLVEPTFDQELDRAGNRKFSQPTDEEIAQIVGPKKSSRGQLQNKLRSFLKLLSGCSLSSFSPTAALAILEYSSCPAAYESFVYLCIERGWARLAAATYRKYRQLPGAPVRGRLMRHIIEVFYWQKDAVGMQQVLTEWLSSKMPMPLKTYQRFIAFYAQQGDQKTLKKVIRAYLKEHRWARLDDSVLSALIQVHTVNSDCEGALRVLEDHAAISSIPPNTTHWNILLKAYSKNNDYEGAMSAFTRLCEESQPDQYSFGIIMGLAGSRGDLRLTLDLLKLSAELGVDANTCMMDAVVDAYCQNDRFEEATLLCVSTTKDTSIEGDRTCLWNTLLHYHARRRELRGVNRTLEYMKDNNVPYDNETYNHLLKALVFCNQAHHALHLIRVAVRDGIFEPTEDHYVLLMSGFIRTKEGHLALKTSDVLRKRFPASTKAATAIIRALGTWAKTARQNMAPWGTDALQHVNRAVWEFRKSLGADRYKTRGTQEAAAEQYSQIIFLLVQLRDFASVQEILTLYTLQFPERASQETIPMKLLLDLMLSEFYEKNYDRVAEIFNFIFTRLVAAGKRPIAQDVDQPDNPARHEKEQNPQDPANTEVLPALRYRLNDAMTTMQRMYHENEDAKGLIGMMQQVRRNGFKMDSKNWNYYVQALARLNKWEEAFIVCEKELMPSWLGWRTMRSLEGQPTNIPLELRRLRSNPRRPRLISYTMYILMRVWVELDKLTLWSPEASRMMQKIKESAPKAVRAVNGLRGGMSRRGARHFYRDLNPRSEDEKTESKVRWLRRLAYLELEEYDEEIEQGVDEGVAQEETDRAAEVVITQKPLGEVSTIYPWRNPWTKGHGLQLRGNAKTIAAESVDVLRSRAKLRQEFELKNYGYIPGESRIEKEMRLRIQRYKMLRRSMYWREKRLQAIKRKTWEKLQQLKHAKLTVKKSPSASSGLGKTTASSGLGKPTADVQEKPSGLGKTTADVQEKPKSSDTISDPSGATGKQDDVQARPEATRMSSDSMLHRIRERTSREVERLEAAQNLLAEREKRLWAMARAKRLYAKARKRSSAAGGSSVRPVPLQRRDKQLDSAIAKLYPWLAADGLHPPAPSSPSRVARVHPLAAMSGHKKSTSSLSKGDPEDMFPDLKRVLELASQTKKKKKKEEWQSKLIGEKKDLVPEFRG